MTNLLGPDPTFLDPEPEVDAMVASDLPLDTIVRAPGVAPRVGAAGRSSVVGAESGDDDVLARVSKGETYASTLSALSILGNAGITRLVMILNGLGGKQLSQQYADHSARLMNAVQPEYLSTLVVSFPGGSQRFRQGFTGFEALDQHSLFLEVERLLQGLELRDTVFRSDHASNYLLLKGQLGADKSRMLAQVRRAIEQPHLASLRSEWQRAL